MKSDEEESVIVKDVFWYTGYCMPWGDEEESAGTNTSIHNFHVSTTSEVQAKKGNKKSKKGEESDVHRDPS